MATILRAENLCKHYRLAGREIPVLKDVNLDVAEGEMLALLGVWGGFPLLDPLAALLVAAFIGHACWGIAQEASRILSDEIVIAESDVRAVVQSVPQVLGCEKIRTRGSADHAFLDLHLWLDGEMPLQLAHATSHVVKDRLMARFPQVADVVIHIEPPPQGSGVISTGFERK